MSSDFYIALAGGSVGALLTAAIGFGGRLTAVPAEIKQNDLDAASRNEDLETWVADRHFSLIAERRGIRNRMAAEGQGTTGALGNALAYPKQMALHEYRDEERRVRREIEAIAGRENWLHSVWRKRTGNPRPSLTAADRAHPVLQSWRSLVFEPPGGPATPVADATKRTLDETIEGLTANSP